MTLLLFLAAAAAVPQPGGLRTFKDWTVGCDNGRSCHATSLVPENGDWDRPVTIGIKRGPEANAAPKLTVFVNEGAVPHALSADGRKLAVRFVGNDEGAEISAADVPAVVTALRSSRELTLLDAGGRPLGTVSLAGASAALLYMDDVQKRVGTVAALARPGPKPAAAPPPPLLPVVRSAAERKAAPIRIDAARIAALRKQYACEPEGDLPGYGMDQAALDADHTLILLGCGAGAYNESSLPLVARRAGSRIDVAVAGFDLAPRWTDDGPPLLVNAEWVPDEQVLTSFSKGRGIGDCGIGSDYGWDGERFRLVQQIEMGECRGSMDYITTWRATLVKR